MDFVTKLVTVAVASSAAVAILGMLIRWLFLLPRLRALCKENAALLNQVARGCQAESALRASEARVRAVMQSVGDAIVSCGSDGRIVFWNPAAGAIFGYQEHEALGQSFEIMLPERLREIYRAELECLDADGRARCISGTMEFVGLTKTGGEFPIDLALSAWRTDDSTLYTCVIRDITERKRSEEALRDSEERFYGAFEGAPIGVALVSPGGSWLKVNRAFCDLVGYTEVDLLTGSFQDITHPDDLDADVANVKELLAGHRRSYKSEKRYIHGRGHVITVWLSVSLVRDAQGQPRYFIAQIQDITEQKRVNAELLWKTAFLEAQVNSSIDGILVVDERGRKLLQNQRFTDLLGVPQHLADDRDDEKQLQWFTANTKNPGEFLERVLYLNSHQNEIGRDEVELRNGKIFDRYSSPVVDRDEKYYGRIWTFRDITERKRSEAELETVHKQLLEASRLGGMAEIATNVLHNVGNVLNSVNVSADLVATSVKTPNAKRLERLVALLREQQGNLGEFVTNDPRGRNLTDYLARFSEQLLEDQTATVRELYSLKANIEHIKEIVAMQQNHARGSGVREMVSLNDLVEASLRMDEDAPGRQRVKIVRDFEKTPRANLEKHKVLQILVNLIRNAKQACQESNHTDKEIRVRVFNDEGQIKISVKDNGVGILPENMIRIFNHGFTTRKDGHGFGLHSGALTAKEMGGALIAQSDGHGQGATFTLELPSGTAKTLSSSPSESRRYPDALAGRIES